MTAKRLEHTDESAVGPHDRKFVQAWNSALAACERKASDGIAWQSRGRGWGALVTASYGGHLAYGGSEVDAMSAYLSM